MTTPHTVQRIAVLSTHAHLHTQAAQLAASLALAVAGNDREWDLLLVLEPNNSAPGYQLQLQQLGVDSPGPVCVDFVGGSVGHRRRSGEGRKQPLARAVGLKHGANPSVLDATGGLGRDAFVLATLGCSLHVLERSPIIAALLQNGLERARADADTALIAARITLDCADARTRLQTLEQAQLPEVIYLDPMYPHREKSALVKKEMRVFRALLGDDSDAPELLRIAMQCARQRVVVKRPRSAPPLAGIAPAFVIAGANTRYDVYPAG